MGILRYVAFCLIPLHVIIALAPMQKERKYVEEIEELMKSVAVQEKQLIRIYAEGIQQLVHSAAEYVHEDNREDKELFSKLSYADPIEISEEYDFIIIGAGSAGSVLANRLSEVSKWRVLVLEAGRPETEVGKIPGIHGLLQLTDRNWGYVNEPNGKSCLGMFQKRCLAPKGKGLGGTSTLNSMVYTRGNSMDYDKWANESLTEWNFHDVLPYFKKSENMLSPEFDHFYHNKGGLLAVEEVQYKPHLAEFLKAGKQAGLHITDINADNQLGMNVVHLNTKRGVRQSAATAFLEPVAKRKNLEILTESRVTKILIDDINLEVKGVYYVKNNKLYMVKARKETILSAGTIASPQILMLSGIGPQEHLEKLKIPCKLNLPVGKNMHDHLWFGLNFVVNATEDRVDSLKLWLTEGRGPLSSPGPIALAYLKTPSSKLHPNLPDVEMVFTSKYLSIDRDHILRRILGYTEEVYDSIMKPLEERYIVTIIIILLHPKSIGEVTLKTKNPFDHPKVYGNFLSDNEDYDIRIMLEGIKKAIAISKTKGLQRLGARLLKVPVPGCHNFGTDDYWKCAIRHIALSGNHQVGTCKMGHAMDKTAVVDESLRVYGVRGLRVADASIIPFSLTAHTNAPVIMVGEKGEQKKVRYCSKCNSGGFNYGGDPKSEINDFSQPMAAMCPGIGVIFAAVISKVKGSTPHQVAVIEFFDTNVSELFWNMSRNPGSVCGLAVE